MSKIPSLKLNNDVVKHAILILITLSLIYYLTLQLISNNIINSNSTFMLYLASATIQAYAALIAIPLSISAIHLSRQYGRFVASILFRKSKRLFLIYFVILLVSTLNIIINPNNLKETLIAQKYSSFGLLIALQVGVTIIPLYYVFEYLKSALLMSPEDIMKELGFPKDVVQLVKKNKLSEAHKRLLSGLSMIRACITDTTMRDDLYRVVSLFKETMENIPWEEEKEETKNGRLDMASLFLNIEWNLDEYVIDPLMKSSIKPNVHLLATFFLSLHKALLKTYSTFSSVFEEHLDKMYRVTFQYVVEGKIEALNEWFFSILWKDTGHLEPRSIARVLLKGVKLSTALVKLLREKPGREEDIEKIVFFYNSALLNRIRAFPEFLLHDIWGSVEDLIYLLRMDLTLLGNVIIGLAFTENRLGKIKTSEPEILYKRILYQCSRLENEIKSILRSNKLVVFVQDKHLRILSAEHGGGASISLENVLKDEEIEILDSFIQRHLKDL